MHTLRSLSLVALLLADVSANRAEPPPGYILVWSDEFDGDKLDLTRWTYRTDSKHWSTQTAANASVSGGKLVFSLRKEVAGDKEYTGAGVISREIFQHGYFEARFKVPGGAGWHTSFWLMKHNGAGGTGTDKAAHELDICEQDSVNPRRYTVNVHRWNPGPHQSLGFKAVDAADLSAGFHVFGCEFAPETVTYTLDGQIVQTIDATWFVHGDHHVWLTSIASFLGDTKRVDETKLPATAEFDWVRVYRKSPVSQ